MDFRVYSKTQLNKAGQTIIDLHASPKDASVANRIINDWRSQHNHPLVVYRIRLEEKAKLIDEEAIVVQRLKKMSSIKAKLLNEPKMKLSRMQDIGGCRAILHNVQQVYALQESLKNVKRSVHTIVRETDYIKSPKTSGYRGIHLIAKYHSEKKPELEGYDIEIQLRTRLQHIWATAVETVSIITNSPLKSSHGSAMWLRLFVLMSCVFAEVEEQPYVPDIPHDTISLMNELICLCKANDIIRRLRSYNNAVNLLNEFEINKNSAYYLLVLDNSTQNLKVMTFRRRDFTAAVKSYSKYEADNYNNTNIDVVLVAANSISSLKQAYPNYFSDLNTFINIIENLIDRYDNSWIPYIDAKIITTLAKI